MGAITATILTYNEEQRIETCLQSLEGIADEIIVVDSGSCDRTVEICKQYGCKVTVRQLSGYGAQRQYATSLTAHDYVLSIDADEVLSPQLRKSLQQLKQSGFTHRVYSFARLNFYCGRPVRHCGWYPDVQIRLFDKRYANWNLHDVSERVIFRDSVRPCQVKGDILHYRCTTPQQYAETEMAHADIQAKVIAATQPHISALTPTISAIKAFITCYIKHNGIRNGRIGFEISRQKYLTTAYAFRQARLLLKSMSYETFTS